MGQRELLTGGFGLKGVWGVGLLYGAEGTSHWWIWTKGCVGGGVKPISLQAWKPVPAEDSEAKLLK
jgi:hypothetical protein